MRDKTKRNNIIHEVIIFLLLLALLMFVTRIWYILFLVILGIFIAALRLLFQRTKTVEVIEPADQPMPPPRAKTEKDLLRLAYGLIQRHITEDVLALYPSARWQWLTPNALANIELGKPIHIILNDAGGYRKACVRIHNLLFQGLIFETAQADNMDTDQQEDFEKDSKEPAQGDPEVINYEYLAFEWVDAHLLDLNARANEAIGQDKTTLLIPEFELPVKESWQDICTQLIGNDFADAAIHDNGILVSLQQ